MAFKASPSIVLILAVKSVILSLNCVFSSVSNSLCKVYDLEFRLRPPSTLPDIACNCESSVIVPSNILSSTSSCSALPGPNLSACSKASCMDK